MIMTLKLTSFLGYVIQDLHEFLCESEFINNEGRLTEEFEKKDFLNIWEASFNRTKNLYKNYFIYRNIKDDRAVELPHFGIYNTCDKTSRLLDNLENYYPDVMIHSMDSIIYDVECLDVDGDIKELLNKYEARNNRESRI